MPWKYLASIERHSGACHYKEEVAWGHTSPSGATLLPGREKQRSGEGDRLKAMDCRYPAAPTINV